MKTEITTHRKTNGTEVYTLWITKLKNTKKNKILCMSSDYNKIIDYKMYHNLK